MLDLMPLRRFIYTLTMYLLTPVILYRLAARGLRYREYFARWRERFGFSTTRTFATASGCTPYRWARSMRRCR